MMKREGNATAGAIDTVGSTAEKLGDRYVALELALISLATASLDGSGLPEGAPLVSAETAVKLLMLRNSTTANRAGGPSPPQIDAAQLRQTLSMRIAAVRHVTAVKANRRSRSKTTPLE